MINPFRDINWSPDASELRKFGRSILIGLPSVALVLLAIRCGVRHVPVKEAWPPSACLAIGGVVIWAITLVSARIGRGLYRAWYFVAACIALVVSNVLLAVFYYAFFTPFAIGLRLLTRRDPLALRRPANAASYWVARGEKEDLQRYLKQY